MIGGIGNWLKKRVDDVQGAFGVSNTAQTFKTNTPKAAPARTISRQSQPQQFSQPAQTNKITNDVNSVMQPRFNLNQSLQNNGVNTQSKIPQVAPGSGVLKPSVYDQENRQAIAQKMQEPKAAQPPQRNFAQKAWDQVNVLDSGRSWGTAKPSQQQAKRNVISQAGDIPGNMFPSTVGIGNMAAEGVAGGVEVARAVTARATGNKGAERAAIDRASRNTFTDKGQGLFGVGSGGVGGDNPNFKDMTARDVAKNVVSAGVGGAAELLPMSKGANLGYRAAGGSIVKQLPRIAGEDAALGLAGSASQQVLQNGRIDPKQLIKDTGMSVLLGQASVGGGVAYRKAKSLIPLRVLADGTLNISRIHKDQLGYTKDAIVGGLTGDARKRISQRAFGDLQARRGQVLTTADGMGIDLSRAGNRKYTSTGAVGGATSGLLDAPDVFNNRTPLPKENEGGYIAGPLALDFSKAQAEGKVFEGVDGKPRFEVDDSGAKIKNPNGKTLGELLDHPKLFEQYDSLKNLPVKTFTDSDSRLSGAYDYENKSMELNLADRNPLGALLHELQHAVQDIEGTATGTSLYRAGEYRNKKLREHNSNLTTEETYKRQEKINQEVDAVKAARRKEGSPLSHDETTALYTKLRNKYFGRPSKYGKLTDFDVYERHAGEAEARAVQARMNMPMSERYVKPDVSKAPKEIQGKTLYRGIDDREWQALQNGEVSRNGNRPGEAFIATDKDLADMAVENHTRHGKSAYMVEYKPGTENKVTRGGSLGGIQNPNNPLDGEYLGKNLGIDDIARVTDANGNVVYESPTNARSTFYDSLDVPKQDLIIRNGDGKAMSVEPKDQLKHDFRNEYNERYAIQLTTSKYGKHKIMLTDKKTGSVSLKGDFHNPNLEAAQKMYDELKTKYKIGDNNVNTPRSENSGRKVVERQPESSQKGQGTNEGRSSVLQTKVETAKPTLQDALEGKSTRVESIEPVDPTAALKQGFDPSKPIDANSRPRTVEDYVANGMDRKLAEKKVADKKIVSDLNKERKGTAYKEGENLDVMAHEDNRIDTSTPGRDVIQTVTGYKDMKLDNGGTYRKPQVITETVDHTPETAAKRIAQLERIQEFQGELPKGLTDELNALKAKFTDTPRTVDSPNISQLRQNLEQAKADLNNPQVDSRFAHKQLAKAQRELDQAHAEAKAPTPQAPKAEAPDPLAALKQEANQLKTPRGNLQDALQPDTAYSDMLRGIEAQTQQPQVFDPELKKLERQKQQIIDAEARAKYEASKQLAQDQTLSSSISNTGLKAGLYNETNAPLVPRGNFRQAINGETASSFSSQPRQFVQGEQRTQQPQLQEKLYSNPPQAESPATSNFLSDSPSTQNGQLLHNSAPLQQGIDTLPQSSTDIVTDENIKKYVKDQVKAQKKTTKTPLKQKITAFFDNTRHALVDDAVAYERYVKDKSVRAELREGVDRVRSSSMMARQFAEDNGMKDLGKMSTSDLNEFQQYLIAKRSQELRAKGVETGRNDSADLALINSARGKYRIQEQTVRDYTQKMLDYSVENGLISKELRDGLLRDNPNYVPMNRVMDAVESTGVHKSKQLGSLSKQTVVQKIQGSERTVENPIESLLLNTERMVNEAQRNNVATKLAAQDTLVERVLKDGDTPKAGYDTLSYLDNGKKVRVEVPALVAKEMKNLNSVLPDWANTTMRVIGAPTRTLRTGATGANPTFAISNLVRDQIQTAITGSVTANLRGTPKAFLATFSPTKGGKALRAELRRNGIIGSEYRQTYGFKSGELMKELQASNQLSKTAWQKLGNPINALADIIGTTESFTRAQQFYGTKGDLTARGQAARNNSLNFSRSGVVTRQVNKLVPFLNAAVQGGRTSVNLVKNKPARAATVSALVIAATLAARAMNEGENKELYDRVGDEEKKENIIWFLPGAKYNPKENRIDGIVKIPMPQMLHPFLDGANNVNGEPGDFAKLAADLFTVSSGLAAPWKEGGRDTINQLTPTFAKPVIEMGLNKSLYTGRELVSEWDKNKNPEDMNAKYSTGLARYLADKTNQPAPYFDNLVGNLSGGLGKDLTKAMWNNPDNDRDGGGLASILRGGVNRRFGSATVTSQQDIQSKQADKYKEQLRSSLEFKSLSKDDQAKALDRIDADTRAIAGYEAKTEQNKSDEIKKDLTQRQNKLSSNDFNTALYVNDSGLSSTSLPKGISADSRKTIEAHDSISSSEQTKKRYAENDYDYKLAKAKFEKDDLEGKISKADRVNRQQTLRKSEVGSKFSKDTRESYDKLTKAELQNLTNNDPDGKRIWEDAVAYGDALVAAGIIKKNKLKTGSASGGSKKKGGSSRKGLVSNYKSSDTSAISKKLQQLAFGSSKSKSGSSAPKKHAAKLKGVRSA